MLPDALAWTAVVLLGLLFGSFLNVCISRLPRHRSIARPGSHCLRCGAPVRAWDNVPVVSWVLLGGRCRSCRGVISMRYPLVEAGYAGLVAASVGRFGLTVEGAAAAVFCFFALGLLVCDLETMLLPDALTWPGVGAGLVFAGVSAGPAGVGWRALAGAGWALGMLAIRWGYYAVRRRHGLGVGDVKLVGMLAVWLGGLSMAVAFFMAVVGAAVVGIGLGVAGVWRHGHRVGEGHEEPGWRMVRLPLGAFLCGGGVLGVFWGERVVAWYLRFWV